MLESAAFHARPSPETDSFKNWQSSARRTALRLEHEPRTAGPAPAFRTLIHDNGLAIQSLSPSNSVSPVDSESSDNGYGFNDFLDVINPLQHLPVIGTLYRKFTGDMMKPISSIVGGALFGGPIGAAASAVNVIAKSSTGKDVAENVLSLAGIDVLPATPPRPEIAYEGLEGTTLAVANLSADSHKNFAATHLPVEIWNT